MSNEELIEEILMEADMYGLRAEVLETARKYMETDKTIDRVHVYELAFCDWVK
jgi:hypothetical protein